MGGTAATSCYCPIAPSAPSAVGSEQKGDEIMERGLRFAKLSARALVVATLGAACLIPIAAGAQQPQPVPPGSSDTLPSISEQKLDAVATALRQLADIKSNYQQKIEESAPADRKRLVDEANLALARTITDQGLTLDEYNSILV